MPEIRTAQSVLDSDFLQLRHHLIDIGAALDRIDRGGDASAVQSDLRYKQIRIAMSILNDGQPNRGERIQMAFSDAYDGNWRRQDRVH